MQPKDALDRLGLAVGDSVEIILVEGTLVVQPVGALEAVTERVLGRRQRAYSRLAEGVQ